MVTLSQVHLSNDTIAASLPNLVAAFVGATSGIGEAALKEFVRKSMKPKCYLVGRSEQCASRIIEESWKIPSTSSSYQPGLQYLTVAKHPKVYTPSRHWPSIHVCASPNSSSSFPSDMQALTTPLYAIRGHLTTLITLGHEALAARAPGVSFLQVFPGAVQTAPFDRVPDPVGLVMRCFIALAGRWVLVPVQESGKRNVFLATSGAFPGRDGGERDGIGLVEGLSVAKGVDGKPGSGVYSLNYDGSEAGQSVMDLLEAYRKEGMVEKVWEHAQAEFERITA